jgi:hypothetical protein
MTMATPTTINTDNKPAKTRPTAQRQMRKAQCNLGASIKSLCCEDFDLVFLDMYKAEIIADRIVKTAGQMAKFERCRKQLD